MEQRKSIQIHEDFFSYGKPKNKTAKSRPASSDVKIRQPKSPANTTIKGNQLKRQSLLRMLRGHQEQRYQEHLKEQYTNARPTTNDFEQANAFLTSIRDANQAPPPIVQNSQPATSVHMHSSVPRLNDVPKFGCLKNGTLPTYRMVQQQAQPTYNHYVPPPPPVPEPVLPVPQTINQDQYSVSTNIEPSDESRALSDFNKNYKQKLKPGKYRKTYKRKYNVGKHKGGKQVGVIVANKKVRANTTLKIQTLKQAPISDIRKFLVKEGFIRVGAQTPEPVLRRMYESIKLLCGSVKNTNADNLLYNYFNDNGDR